MLVLSSTADSLVCCKLNPDSEVWTRSRLPRQSPVRGVSTVGAIQTDYLELNARELPPVQVGQSVTIHTVKPVA